MLKQGPVFPSVSKDTVATAIKKTVIALTSKSTVDDLAEYYNPLSDYAGATFAGLEPNNPSKVTAADLLATSTLNVKFPVRAVRSLLQETTTTDELSSRLQALPQSSLETATAADFAPMTDFYDYAKRLLSKSNVVSPNPWVTTSKLVARKRPDLFPVRDRVVCKYLGINKLGDARKDWVVFRELMNTPRIQEELDLLPTKIQEQAGSDPLKLDHEPLRLLDAALWMHAIKTNKK